jgi:hypothetical protein
MLGANLSGHEGLPRDDTLPRGDGDKYRVDWAWSRNYAVRRGVSSGQQELNRSDAGQMTEEAA